MNIHIRQRPTQNPTTNMPLLTDLPPELLLLISDLLPPTDLLCLSLSTHTLYDHLSSQPVS